LAGRLRFRVSGFEFRVSDFRLQTSDFRLQTSGFRLQASDFRLQASGFRLQASGFRLQTSDFRLQTSDFRLRTSGFGLQASDFRLQASDFRFLFGTHYMGLQNRVAGKPSQPPPGLHRITGRQCNSGATPVQPSEHSLTGEERYYYRLNASCFCPCTGNRCFPSPSASKPVN
jgi:hypothetical protein